MESNGTASREINSSAQASVALHPTAKARKGVGLTDLTPEDQRVLVQELENAIIYFASNQFPTYLDGLGIIFPKKTTRSRVITMKEKFVVHRETVLTVGFEKARELVGLHRERFVGILDSKELGYRIYDRASPFLSAELSEIEIRKLTRAIIDEVRREVIDRGRSTTLKAVGDLYALHNRQGDSAQDWYAGADILLRPKFERVLSSERSPFLERPVLASAFEPFEALIGQPACIVQVDVHRELAALGYDIERSVKLAPFSVAVFSEQSKEGTAFTYVSESLRNIAFEKASSRGTELVVQCFIAHQRSSGLRDQATCQPPMEWPVRMLTLGWLLLHSSKLGSLSIGAGMHGGVRHLFGDEPSCLSGIFTLPCRRIGGEQLAENGPFNFRQLVAIAEDEANIASLHGPHVMTSLLEHKKLNVFTKPSRASIVSKTSLALPN